MGKKIVRIILTESCDDCGRRLANQPPYVKYTPYCLAMSPKKEIENTDTIPDWCPLEDDESGL